LLGDGLLGRKGRITSGYAGLWADKHIAPWRALIGFVKSQCAPLPAFSWRTRAARPIGGAPLGKEGDLADRRGWGDTVAPSAIAFAGRANRVPRELNLSQIAVCNRFRFRRPAARARVTNGRDLQFSAWLLSHDFSRHFRTTHRRYGGNFENRNPVSVEPTRGRAAGVAENLPRPHGFPARIGLGGCETIGRSVSLSPPCSRRGR